jgi:hypothetical protein
LPDWFFDTAHRFTVDPDDIPPAQQRREEFGDGRFTKAPRTMAGELGRAVDLMSDKLFRQNVLAYSIGI